MTRSTPRSRPRRWVLFFLALAVMAAIAVIVPIVYNLRQQLEPGELADARRRWRDHAPADYDLQYLVRTEHDGREEKEQYLVKVRGGQTVLVAGDGEVLYVDPALALITGPGTCELSRKGAARYGVTGLFDQMETALHENEASGRRDYLTASFAPDDGHPFRYVHRVRGTHERMEWDVKLTRITAPGG